MKTLIKFTLAGVLFIVFMAALLKVAQGPAITSNFHEEAPNFQVLGIKGGEYEVLSLSEALRGKGLYRFNLEDKERKLELGDVYSVEVLESADGKQRVRFVYSDTYVSESIYEVSNNTIRPIKYRILGSIGHVGLYLLLVAVAVTIALSLSNFMVQKWSARKKEDSHT